MTTIMAVRFQSMQTQHVAALADITAKNNIQRINPIGVLEKKVRFVPTTRITAPSTIKPKPRLKYLHTIEEDTYHSLLGSPDPATLLNIAIAMGAEAINAPPSANISARRGSTPRAATPTPTIQTLTNLGSEQLVPISETSVTRVETALPVTLTNYKGSPLDKALPPKPVLRCRDSPERRGLLDATDSDSITMDHPVIEPKSPGGETLDSFKVSPSLTTLSTESGEVEIGTAVIVEGEAMNSVTGMDVDKAKTVNAIPVRVAKGTPIRRIQGLSTMPSNNSLKGRETRYGVGLNIRKEPDAHEIIMGSDASPHPPRTSSLPKAVKSVGQLSAAARLSRPTAASAARAVAVKKSMLAPGKSFLDRASNSKISLLSSGNKSVISTNPSVKRDSRASATSTSLLTPGSLPQSNTISSLKKASKGFKSRFADIFSGRRRTNVYSEMTTANNGYAKIDEEEDDLAVDSDLEDMVTPVPVKRAPSKLLTTYKGSGMKQKIASTDNIRSDNYKFMGKVSDRAHSDREQRRHEREEGSINHAAENFGFGRDMPGQGTARGVARVGRGGDEPPSPPPSRGGPAGHYGEGENAGGNTNNMTEEEFDRYLGDQLTVAQDHLSEVLEETANMGGDPEARLRAARVVEALGASILAARQAHIAGIQLRLATSELIQNTVMRAALARQAVAEAVGGVVVDGN